MVWELPAVPAPAAPHGTFRPIHAIMYIRRAHILQQTITADTAVATIKKQYEGSATELG